MITLILVALLGHPSCHVRSAAELSLERLAAPSWPYLVAGAQSADPERAMRSQRLLDALLWDCTLPYIDALPDAMVDRYQVIGRYVQAAIAAGHARQTGGDWPAYREATRLWLADGGDPGLLAEMRRRTINYNCLSRWELD